MDAAKESKRLQEAATKQPRSDSDIQRAKAERQSKKRANEAWSAQSTRKEEREKRKEKKDRNERSLYSKREGETQRCCSRSAQELHVAYIIKQIHTYRRTDQK